MTRRKRIGARRYRTVVVFALAAANLGFGTPFATTSNAAMAAGGRMAGAVPVAETAAAAQTPTSAAPAVAAVPSAATAPTSTRTAPMIRLLAQGPIVNADGPYRIDLAVQSPTSSPLPGGIGVAVTVHRRVRTRAQFRSTVRGGDLGAVLGLVPPIDVVGDGRTEQLVPIELRFGPRTDACQTCIPLDADGVYPVNVELRSLATDDVIDRFTTHVIRQTTAATGPRRLKVAVVVPLHLAPNLSQGKASATTTRSFVELVEAMAGRPLVPLTVAPTPETIEALSRQPDDPLLTQFVSSLSGREVLASPYVRWSTSTLEQRAMADELLTQRTMGKTILTNVIGSAPTDGVLLAGERIPDAEALDRAGTTTLLVNASSIRPGGLNASHGPVLLDPGAPTGVATPARTAFVLDTDVQADLSTKRDPVRRGGEDVLRAQHVLSDLTMVAASSAATGLVIQVPEQTPQATLDALLAGLGTTNPIVEPVTLTDLAANTTVQQTDGNPLIVTPVPVPTNTVTQRALTDADATTIGDLRARLSGFVSLFVDQAPDVSIPNRLIATAVTDDLPIDQRRRSLAEARRLIDAFLAKVRLSRPDNLTVTARQASVPIGVINNTGLAIRVNLIVRSSSVRLRDSGVIVDAIGTTEVRQTIEVPGRVAQAHVDVETRGPGSFSLVARLATTTDVDLAIARYRLRSTAISGLGSFLTIGSLFVLLMWWIRWRRKNGKNLRRHEQ